MVIFNLNLTGRRNELRSCWVSARKGEVCEIASIRFFPNAWRLKDNTSVHLVVNSELVRD